MMNVAAMVKTDATTSRGSRFVATNPTIEPVKVVETKKQIALSKTEIPVAVAHLLRRTFVDLRSSDPSAVPRRFTSAMGVLYLFPSG